MSEINVRDPKLTLRLEHVLLVMEKRAGEERKLAYFATVYRERCTIEELQAWCDEFNGGSHLLPKGTVVRVKQELGLISEGTNSPRLGAPVVTDQPAQSSMSGQSTAAPVRSREEMRADAIASLLALGQRKREAASRVEAALSSREPFADAGELVKIALRQTIALHAPTPAKPKAPEQAKDDGASPWEKRPRGPINKALAKVRPLLERIAAGEATPASQRSEHQKFLWNWLGTQNPAPQKAERFIRWTEQLGEARQETAKPAAPKTRKKPAPARVRALPCTIKPVREFRRPAFAQIREALENMIAAATRERDHQDEIITEAEGMLARIEKIGGAS